MQLTTRAKNWAGQRVFHLTVEVPIDRTPNGTIRWQCRCDCGNVIKSSSGDLGKRLKNGVGVCGAWCEYTQRGFLKGHGISQSAEYRAWTRMKSRCNNPNNASYARYGARGIRVCVRWRKSFPSFLKDMGRIPAEGMSLDRKNGKKGYSKANCRWATSKEQGNNRSTNVFLDTPWGRLTITQAAERAGILPSLLMHRLNVGYKEDKLLLPPKEINALWDTEWGKLTVIEACAKGGISPKNAWSRIARGFTDPALVFTKDDLRLTRTHSRTP